MPIKGEMKVKLVTAEILQEQGATCPALLQFQAEWPDGAEVTLANLLRAAELKLNLLWWTRHFLPHPLWAEFDRQVVLLGAEFTRQVVLLWAEFDHQVVLLGAEVDHQVVLLQEEFTRQVVLLQKELTRQVVLLQEEFSRQVARLIWQLLEEGKCQ